MCTYCTFVMRHTNDGAIKSEVITENTANLSKGNVLIKVMYSNISSYDIVYSDHNINKNNNSVRTPGVDAAGIVVESSSSLFHKGDEVVIYGGLGFGIDFAGGFGQYVRVPDSLIFHLPTGISLKDSMTIGSDGLAAALAVMEVIISSRDSKNKNVLVTGAARGIGAFASAILKLCGFNVTAVTAYPESESFIRDMGADTVISEEKLINKSKEYLLDAKYVAAVDTMGGEVLSYISKILDRDSIVAVCGTSGSKEFHLSVYPFILRGINLVGIDPLNCSSMLKQDALYKLAGDWYIKSLPLMCNEISIFEIADYFEQARNNMVKGRIVINHSI